MLLTDFGAQRCTCGYKLEKILLEDWCVEGDAMPFNEGGRTEVENVKEEKEKEHCNTAPPHPRHGTIEANTGRAGFFFCCRLS